MYTFMQSMNNYILYEISSLQRLTFQLRIGQFLFNIFIIC